MGCTYNPNATAIGLCMHTHLHSLHSLHGNISSKLNYFFPKYTGLVRLKQKNSSMTPEVFILRMVHRNPNRVLEAHFEMKKIKSKKITCIIHKDPCRQRSMPSQSKPITSFFSDEGLRNSVGSWEAWLTTWIGTNKSSALLSTVVPPAWHKQNQHKGLESKQDGIVKQTNFQQT